MKKYFASFFCLVLLFFGVAGNVQAEESIFSYTIQPIFPKNQKIDISNYFHLYSKPGETQQISFMAVNKTEKAVIVDVTPANALTSPTGDIQYLAKDNTESSWITDSVFMLKDGIKVAPVIELKPNEKKIIPVSVTTPDEKGEFLGALIFKERKEAVQSKKSITIQNEYAFILGIVSQTSNDKEFTFTIGDVSFPERRTNPNLQIEFENPNPNILNDIEGSYRVVNKKKKMDKTYAFGKFDMAPKTKIQFPTEVNPTIFPIGEYELFVEATVNGKKIEKKMNFEIEEKIQKTSISTESESKKKVIVYAEKPFYKNPVFWGLSSIILLLFIAFIWLLLKRKK